MSDTNKPAAKVSLFPVTAAIFRNQNQKGGVYYSVTIERSYRDEAGNWQTAGSFNASELLLVAKVADLAHSEIYKLRASDRNGELSDQEAA